MKKKVYLVIAMVALLAFVLCGCQIGNRNIGLDLTQTFSWGIIQLGNGELI